MSLEDKLYHYLNFYKKSPDWVKKTLVLPFKFFPREKYLGKNYKLLMVEALKYEFESEDKIREFQFKKLKEVLNDAYKHIQFYREKWQEYGVKPNMIHSFEDYSKLIPFTTREELQNNTKKFISDKYSLSNYMKINTGGSSGTPLVLYYLKGYTRMADKVYNNLIWSRFNFKMGDCYARLRGDYIGKEKLYTFDPYRNSLILSSFNLNETNADYYLDLLTKYRVKYICAYPASLYVLVQASKRESFKLDSLVAIMLGSENIFDYQLEKFRSFFQIDDFSISYGHAEFSNISGNCKYSNNYHFYPAFSYTEFCNTEDSKLLDDENIREIVGTSFLNPLMPMIRYRSQDFGIEGPSTCKCGRNHKSLSKIIGRSQEVAIGYNGEKISLTALIFGRHMEYLNHTLKIQVINYEPGKLKIKVVPKSTFTEKHRLEFLNSFSTKQGIPFKSEIIVVDKIETTRRGKHKFFIKTF